MSNAIRFTQTKTPKQKGELARLKVLQGPGYGAIYVVTGAPVKIGRGEECDVKLLDLKASRVHAELSIQGPNLWTAKDLGSANGIQHNGKGVREAQLKAGDTLTLGETTLEFQTAEAGTMALIAPPRSIEEVQAQQSKFEQQKNKVKGMGLAAIFSSSTSNSLMRGMNSGISQGMHGLNDPKLRKNILYFAVAAAAIFLFIMPDDHPTKRAPAGKTAQGAGSSNDLSVYLPDTGVSSKTADTFFKDGFREYLAGNFNRARVQFETVLQIAPGHSLANIYLENCNKAVNSEVKFHLDYGKKAYDSGKLRESRAHYERILRLLFKDQSNENFIKAKDYYEKVNSEIKMSSSELASHAVNHSADSGASPETKGGP
jgi:hypothetical protein